MKIDFSDFEKMILNMFSDEKKSEEVSILRELIRGDVLIYGCGESGRTVRQVVENAELDFAGFIDDSAIGDKIYTLDEAEGMFEDVTVIIAISNQPAYESVRAKLNFNKIIDIAELAVKLPALFTSAFYTDNRELSDKLKKFIEVDELLDNNTCFLKYLEGRITLNEEIFKCIQNSEPQYMPEEIELTPDEVIVDLGAFEGDSLKLFYDKLGGFKGYYAYEADRYNHEKLTTLADNYSNVYTKHNCITDRDKDVSFVATGTQGSRIGNSAESVKGVTLDGEFSDISPTLIKADIEGEEMNMLRGAVNLMKNSRAVWCISLYHTFNDIWQIPLFMKEHLPDDYKYMIKYHNEEKCDASTGEPRKRLEAFHAGYFTELVLYAFPPERLK